MKKILFYLVGAIIMLNLAISCSNDDSEVPDGSTANLKAIGFKTFLDKTVTRGISTQPGNLRQDFWVYAYYDSIGDRYSTHLKPNFMFNQHVVYNDSTFSYTPTKYWPATGDVNFYAWTPNNSTNLTLTNPLTRDSIGYPTFNYRVNSTIANQEDLLIAAAEDQDGTSGSVNLQFAHALTKVGFCARTAANYASAGVTVKIMSITLNNIINSGSFSFQQYATNYVDSVWWSPTTSSTSSYVPNIGASTGALIGYYGNNYTYMELPTNNQFLLMIPQSFANNSQANITIVYKIFYSDGTATQTFTKVVPLQGTPTWVPGNYVNYAITISLNVVTFTGVVSDWNVINPTINILPNDDDE